MFLHVQSVRHVRDYILELEFSDGSVKMIDLERELHGEVFEPLRDLDFFRRVAVNPDSQTIEWPSGADLAPEFLFENGIDAERVA